MGAKINEKVKTLILTGPTAQKIEDAIINDENYKGSPTIIHAENLKNAVEIASKNAQNGDIVTLSPACASFDAFPNFAARGKYFKSW